MIQILYLLSISDLMFSFSKFFRLSFSLSVIVKFFNIINFSDESGSDRDSGIETGDSGTAGLGTWSHSGHGLPVSYGLDRCDRSPVNSEDREKIREVLETGVRRMKLENKKTDQKHQGMDSHE